jgi:hypothetical protein
MIMAKAERLDPSTKAKVPMLAQASDRSAPQTASQPSREPAIQTPPPKEEPPKNKTFFQKLNPFK